MNKHDSRSNKNHEEYSKPETDQEILEALNKLLTGTNENIDPDGDGKIQHLLVSIGQRLRTQIERAGFFPNFKGNFGIEIMKTWKQLNFRQKINYVAHFLIPLVQYPASVNYDLLKSFFDGQGTPWTTQKIVATAFEFFTGRTIEQFLNTEPPNLLDQGKKLNE